MIVCNGRILKNKLTGVQRYVIELMERFNGEVDIVQPDSALHGSAGHAWEQFVLPFKLKQRLLWSPSITGPLMVEKQVVTIHDVVPLDHPEWLNPRFAAWYKFNTPRLARKVRRIIVDSEFSRDRLLHFCPEVRDKIDVIYLAADARFSPRGHTEIDLARIKLEIPTARYVVALGSLEPRKNLTRLLAAWKLIVGKVPDDIGLVIAGGRGKSIIFDGVNLDSLPPRVHLTGHVSDELLPALYSGAIASLYPSLYEGFGLPPLEAMACGTAVLTSNVASLPEVVGTAALKINPLDIREMADALLSMIENDSMREDMANRGLIQASKFNWDTSAKATLTVLRSMDY